MSLTPYEMETILLCAYRLQAAERKIDVKVRNMGY